MQKKCQSMSEKNCSKAAAMEKKNVMKMAVVIVHGWKLTGRHWRITSGCFSVCCRIPAS